LCCIQLNDYFNLEINKDVHLSTISGSPNSFIQMFWCTAQVVLTPHEWFSEAVYCTSRHAVPGSSISDALCETGVIIILATWRSVWVRHHWVIAGVGLSQTLKHQIIWTSTVFMSRTWWTNRKDTVLSLPYKLHYKHPIKFHDKCSWFNSMCNIRSEEEGKVRKSRLQKANNPQTKIQCKSVLWHRQHQTMSEWSWGHYTTINTTNQGSKQGTGVLNQSNNK